MMTLNINRGKMNKYKLEAAHPWTLYGHPGFVTFTTPDQDKLPVPSPTYHAACGKVAHLSGTAECIAKLHRDMEECRTLHPDGASAPILEHAIFQLQARRYDTSIEWRRSTLGVFIPFRCCTFLIENKGYDRPSLWRSG